MKRLAAIIIGLMLSLGAYAQDGLTFTSSGGLTVGVPAPYLAAEIAPLRVGLTNRETGASLLLAVDGTGRTPEDVLAAELRRLGISMDEVQAGALNARSENARISGARAVRMGGSVMVASVAFNDGMVGLLTIQPADSVPLPIIKDIINSVRIAPRAGASAYPLCGSDELPNALTTSGGLSICFPASFSGEEKGTNAAGIADLANGVIISIYARADLETLIGGTVTDAQAGAVIFGEMLRTAGAEPLPSDIQYFTLDSGQAAAMPLVYPDVGSGRIIAVHSGDDVIVLSAVLVGTPPANITDTLNAIANSLTLGPRTGDLGAVRAADLVVDLGIIRFTAVPGWSLISSDGGMAALERADVSALMSAAAAPADSGWNSTLYRTSVLPAAAQFAGDTAYDPASVETISSEAGRPTVELYDSTRVVPDGTAAANLTALVTLEGRAFVVLQASAPRSDSIDAVRAELLQMAASVR